MKKFLLKCSSKIIEEFKWFFDLKDWKAIFRSVSALTIALFCVATVVMNLMASKTIILTEPSWLGVTGGIIISWIPFLCMDVIVRTFGARVATKINILGLVVNLVCIGLYQLVASVQIGGDPSQYEAFNATFNQTWQIFVASSIAYLISSIVNNYSNVAIGKLFKKNPDGRAAYYTRAYISSVLGQFVDNFIFTGLAFMVFFQLSTGTSLGWTWLTVFGTAIAGAGYECVMEFIFSPIGYRVWRKWNKERLNDRYIEYKRGEIANA